jgi:hypothetical protein
MPTQNVLNQIEIHQNGLTATYKIGDIIDGYYDSTTGKFYEESTHTTEIQGASGFLYVDLGNNDIYIYKTSTSSFVKVSGSGGTADNIKFGYLNPSDGKFYEDDSYTVEIPADATKIYIDLAEDTIYRYDATETEYVSIGGGGGGTTYTAGFGLNINSEDEISTTDFVGTQDEWNALSAAQKAAYDVINITDDVTSVSYKPGHSISDGTTEKTQRDGLVFDGFSVTDDSTNEVTKIAEIPYTAGDGITITNKEVAVSDDISRTWTGTQSQWDAIVDKSPYDGWIINITDDAGVGVGPVVDVVEENNFNAITSNAVYDAIGNGFILIEDGVFTHSIDATTGASQTYKTFLNNCNAAIVTKFGTLNDNEYLEVTGIQSGGSGTGVNGVSIIRRLYGKTSTGLTLNTIGSLMDPSTPALTTAQIRFHSSNSRLYKSTISSSGSSLTVYDNEVIGGAYEMQFYFRKYKKIVSD